MILGDVVYLIRKYRPDVIVTRFPPDERAGHGHHNSSAYLAHEAFKISGDPAKYPEQLKLREGVAAQAHRLEPPIRVVSRTMPPPMAAATWRSI